MDKKSSVPCLKTIHELNQLEEKEDCVILEFDPNDDELDLSKLTFAESDDLHVIATKGKVACRDYPHPRHACAKFAFRKTPHESHCELCYCYVCDIIAPCKKWVGKSKHCDAFDTEIWSIKRKLTREAVERKKEAYKDYPHPRYMCVQFPFEKTPHDKHCEMCCCYVCETNAPCEKWVGTSNHCLAINDEKWRIKRELCRQEQELRAKQNESISGAGASIITGQQEESNPVHQERTQQQEQQTFQNNSVQPPIEEEELSEETQVYVGNLSHTVDCDNLFEHFMRAGVVEQAQVSMYDPRDVRCSVSLGYGLVTMGTVEEAEKAVRMFNGSSFEGNVLTVKRNKGGPKETYSIFVGNLSWSTGRERLEEFFSKHGYKVVRARRVVDQMQPRCFGFVLMETECDRLEAIKTLNGRELDGRELRLGVAAY